MDGKKGEHVIHKRHPRVALDLACAIKGERKDYVCFFGFAFHFALPGSLCCHGVAPASVRLFALKPGTSVKEKISKKRRMIVYTKMKLLPAIGIPIFLREKIVITKYYRSFRG
jgi:hypothetical protein